MKRTMDTDLTANMKPATILQERFMVLTEPEYRLWLKDERKDVRGVRLSPTFWKQVPSEQCTEHRS